jgi:hypothetical protein
VPDLGWHEALFGAPAEHGFDPPNPGVDHISAQAAAIDHGSANPLQFAQGELVGWHLTMPFEQVVDGVVEVDDLSADLAGTSIEELALCPDRELGRQLLHGWVGAGRSLRPAPRGTRLGILASQVGGHDLAVALLDLGTAVYAEVDLATLAVGPTQEDHVGTARLVVDDRGKPGLLHDSTPDVG